MNKTANRKRRACFALLLALLPAGFLASQALPDPPLVDPFRQWKNSAEKILAKARFAYQDGNQVCLWQETGQQLLIPEAQLSAADRKWIADHPHKILRGKVIFVADGDTIGLLDADRQMHRIRLEGIDAPESGQAFGKRSKQTLDDAIYGKEVLVTYEDEDRYGRILGQIYHGDHWLNLDQLTAGMAWHYRHFSGDAFLAETQEVAQKAKVGLWKDKSPQQPWRFRLEEKRREEAAQADNDTKQTTPTGYWLNTSSNVRHNAGCKHFGKTSRGKYCTATEGKPCGICGG
ncbi:hypothetical protein GC197_13025 [bacterium]|nr:hypothetical protein [bacterium]